MEALSFHAQCIATEHPDGDCHLLGFADSEFETDLYLMLQRAFEDEPDEEPDICYFEWCGQDMAGYGGISRFILRRDGAEVIFDERAKRLLDGLGRLSISFQLAEDEYLALRKAAAGIFRGSECLIIADARDVTP